LLTVPDDTKARRLYQEIIFFAAMISILVFANLAPERNHSFTDKQGSTFKAVLISTTPEYYEIHRLKEGSSTERVLRSDIRDEGMVSGIYTSLFSIKWYITGASLLLLLLVLYKWFKRDEIKDWGDVTLDFALQILPLLFGGVLVAGFMLGRPGHEGIIPSHFVTMLVGGNSVLSNLFAAIFGASMYFATLTEVPILQGLLGSGMGKGPALALLLSGPALSLPSMLVINSVLGLRKTVVYVLLVIVFSTIGGLIFGFVSG